MRPTKPNAPRLLLSPEGGSVATRTLGVGNAFRWGTDIFERRESRVRSYCRSLDAVLTTGRGAS